VFEREMRRLKVTLKKVGGYIEIYLEIRYRKSTD